MKRCSTCHELKFTGPGGDFNLDRRAADGYQPTCKACHRRLRRERGPKPLRPRSKPGQQQLA